MILYNDKSRITHSGLFLYTPNTKSSQSYNFVCCFIFASSPLNCSIVIENRLYPEACFAMLANNRIASGEIPLISHFLLSKVTSCHGLATHTSSPLSSFKSLAQWAIHVTAASYNKSPLLDTLLDSWNWLHSDTPKADVPLLQRTFEAPVYVFCVSYLSGKKDGVGTTLLAVYTFDKTCALHLIASAYIRASHPVTETTSRRVTYEYSRNPYADLPYAGSLLTVTLTSLCFTTTHQYPCNIGRRFLGFRSSSKTNISLFNFLRYIYPKRLGKSREVILDTEEYRITHVGKGAFALISRVLHKPTGETRAMKRITFDEKGLAKYLATNEISTLKAMKDNHWFPPLLNNFTDGTEFVITMVRGS